METIRTITCSIWSEDSFGAGCGDVTDGQSEFDARVLARENAEEQYTRNGGDFGPFYRIWFTDVSFPKQEAVHPTITATLPPLEENSAIDAAVSVS